MNLNKILIVAKYTFKEILKSKVLYLTFSIGVALTIVTFVATEFTYGVPEKVALDFGLGMLSLSSIGIALFMGATLLPNELDSRTVYMVISRPVARWEFISGKVIGLMGILIVNVAILSMMTLACALILGGEINSPIVLAIIYNVLESLLLMLLVVFLSLFANTILSTAVALLILVLGHGIKEAQGTIFAQGKPFLKSMLEIYHWILPGFYKLNLKDFVIYNQTIPTSYLVSSFLYGTLYSLFLFLLIVFIFNRKNLD